MVIDQIKRFHGKIKFAANEYIGFEKIAFDKCPICKHEHSASILVYLYEIMVEEKIRNKIKHGIQNYLKNKYSAELYYLSSIYEILNARGKFFDQLIHAAKLIRNSTSIRSIFTGEDDRRFPILNMLINLSYKYEIDLSFFSTNQI